MKNSNSTKVILAIYKTAKTDINGEKTYYLKTQATVSTSDFQEYSVGLMGGNSRHICYHINIPKPISKVKLGFINEVEEKIANIEVSLSDEQIEDEIITRLNEYELEDIIKESQEQKAGLKVGKLHYGLDELVEIKNYLIELGEMWYVN